MKELLLGNEAIARGAYEAGVKVATAYPGTPSTEITECIAKHDDIYAEWSPNEKVALEVAIGSAIGGGRAIVSMKHVGLNVAADPLFTVAYTGINAGLVIVVADDPGMHSSQNEQNTRYYGKAANIPILEPSDSQEAKDFVILAFDISEEYDTPVIIRMTTRVSHSQSIVEICKPQGQKLKEYKKDISKYVMMPAMAKARHIIVEDRMNRLVDDSNNMSINEVETNDRSVGIITSGISYQYVKEVLPNASILKLGMVYPFPDRLIREFASTVDRLYVVEELEPFIEEHVKSMGIETASDNLFSIQGELSGNTIYSKITGKQPNVKSAANVPGRPPVLCPGCPHRGVYYMIKKLRLHAAGDIGCYTLGALPPLEGIDTCICMGASIGMVHGIEKARGRDDTKSWIGVIGDSTFIHSGITGLIDIVYNKGISTVAILDNSTTGMTGHQDHPATGKTIKGEPAPVLNLVELISAIGIEHIEVVDPYDITKVETVLKKEVERDEPSVIIFSRPCALLTKEKSRPFAVDKSKCRHCNMCMDLACPAITRDENTISIDKTLCNGCGVCADVCRFNAIERLVD